VSAQHNRILYWDDYCSFLLVFYSHGSSSERATTSGQIDCQPYEDYRRRPHIPPFEQQQHIHFSLPLVLLRHSFAASSTHISVSVLLATIFR
jgi:hypothetical protein